MRFNYVHVQGAPLADHVDGSRGPLHRPSELRGAAGADAVKELSAYSFEIRTRWRIIQVLLVTLDVGFDVAKALSILAKDEVQGTERMVLVSIKALHAVEAVSAVEQRAVARLSEPVFVEDLHFELRADSVHHVVDLSQSLEARQILLVFSHLRGD